MGATDWVTSIEKGPLAEGEGVAIFINGKFSVYKTGGRVRRALRRANQFRASYPENQFSGYIVG